jgi:hypothetical protein
MRKTLFCFALLFAAGCQTSVCRADDWPQFRRDSSHSATSTDELKFPLTELWSWSKAAKNPHTPLYHVVVWNEYAYFTASDEKARSLICADARTGKVKWQKELATGKLEFEISDIAGPAVTSGGTVFVYDWNRASAFGENLTVKVEGSDCSFSSVDSFCVRTFDAATGKEGPYFPMAAMGATGVLRRLSLMEGARGQEVRPVPATFAGCPP